MNNIKRDELPSPYKNPIEGANETGNFAILLPQNTVNRNRFLDVIRV